MIFLRHNTLLAHRKNLAKQIHKRNYIITFCRKGYKYPSLNYSIQLYQKYNPELTKETKKYSLMLKFRRSTFNWEKRVF